MKISLAEALARLPLPKTEKWPLGVWDAEMLAHGTMSLEIFAPKEIYIVVSGSGEFAADNQTYTFGPGDALFVPAGVEHRFTRFTPDFVTWVIFYGPKGGETGASSSA
jgi:uncharacterized protein YjlB